MRTDAAVLGFAVVAVHAEDLKSSWVAVILEPLVNPGASAPHTLPMGVPVVEYVIDGQESRLSFSATGANISAICHDRFVSQLGPVLSAPFSFRLSPFRIFPPLVQAIVFKLRIGLSVGPHVLALVFCIAGPADSPSDLTLLEISAALATRNDQYPLLARR